ncbi:MAG: DUF6054 family protein [Erysipelotrichaceae bacterium]
MSYKVCKLSCDKGVDVIKVLDNINRLITFENVYNDIKNCGSLVIYTSVFEKYFFRTGSYASVFITVYNSDDHYDLTVICCGGGDGILNFDWGVHNNLISGVLDIFKSYGFEMGE